MPESLKQFEGKYEIICKLAEGGMGAVYKARHRLLDEIRVVKVMRPQMEQQDQSKERFLREAQIAVKVRHHNIAQMYDFSIDHDGSAYIVIEYVDGTTLQDILKASGTPPLPLVLEIAQQSLKALAYLHQKGIVHRDIAPDNIMVARDDDGSPEVKLIDLGIAKLESGESNLTATGMFLGKVRYASPEHFRAQEGATVDSRSDIYSFGLVLYELLTGVHPIGGKTWSELIAGHLFQPPRAFADSDPDGLIPENVRDIVLKAIAKAPEERFGDAKAFRKAIVAVAREVPDSSDGFDDMLAGRAVKSAPEPKPTPDSAVDDERSKKRITALLDAADRLIKLNLHAEAKVQLDTLLQMDPDNEEAAQLLAQVEKAGHRERTIAETRSAVEELIEAGSLEEAAARIDSVIAILGQVEELHPLNERIVKLRDEHRDAAVQALTEKSERLAQQGQHQEAIARLETALGLDPDNPTVQARLADAREALDRQQREQEPPEVDVAAAGELAVPAAPRPVELAAAFPETPVAVAGSSRARVPTSVPWKIVAPAAAAVLALIVVTVLVVRGFGPSEESDVLAGGLSTGTLVINALPWAEVVEIRDAEDNPVELPSDAYTPISLDLPAGSYRISLRDPQGDRPVTFDAQVTAGDTASRTERFSPPDATQFLQKYGL